MKNYTGLSSFPLLGIPVTITEKREILEYVSKWLDESRGMLMIFTPNPEILQYAQQHKNFKEIVRSAQINLPDGGGVVWGIRRSGGPIVSRLAGVDFMEYLCHMAADQRFSVGFLGTHPKLALAAYERLKQRYPGLEGTVIECPTIGVDTNGKLYLVSGISYEQKHQSIQDTKYKIQDISGYIESVVEQIRHDKLRILFVALGFPKQEYLIAALRERLEKERLSHSVVLMAVGGSLDYLSGAVPRAPHWWRDRGGEWLYRLIHQPWRIGRQLRGAAFFLDVIRGRK